jgi:hypothetical protein
MMHDLVLSQQLSIIKFSQSTSWVKWFKGEKTNISKTISVLILRVLIWLEILQSVISGVERTIQHLLKETAKEIQQETSQTLRCSKPQRKNTSQAD